MTKCSTSQPVKTQTAFAMSSADPYDINEACKCLSLPLPVTTQPTSTVDLLQTSVISKQTAVFTYTAPVKYTTKTETITVKANKGPTKTISKCPKKTSS